MGEDEVDEVEAVEPQVEMSKAEKDTRMGQMDNIAPEGKSLDENKAKQAMASFTTTQAAGKEAARQHEKELQAIKVSQEDVALVAEEFEVDKKLAERRLKEHSSNLAATLTSFM